MTNFEWIQSELKDEIKNKKEVSVHVYEHVRTMQFQFCGWELVLLEDGTYYLNDTSGG